MGTTEKAKPRCTQKVYTGVVSGYRCHKSAWKDGYCRWHHRDGNVRHAGKERAQARMRANRIAFEQQQKAHDELVALARAVAQDRNECPACGSLAAHSERCIMEKWEKQARHALDALDTAIAQGKG